MSKQHLFIDELGNPGLKDKKSDLYILSCCSVDESERARIREMAERIKFKYWGWNHHEIVFHSYDIGQQSGDFAIFKNNQQLYDEFLNDLLQFLATANYRMFFVLIDKSIAIKRGWNNIKIFKETSIAVIKMFLLMLLGQKIQGSICIETSSESRDFYFLRSLNFFLAGGIPELGVGHEVVKKSLTAISFVTKKNHDIEEQISDLLAYGAKCKQNKLATPKSYEEKIVKVLESKIYKIPMAARATKLKFYSQISPFLVLPQ